MNRKQTTARLWLAHLALVEADHHTRVDEPFLHPLGLGVDTHHVKQSASEGERLARMARSATADALISLGDQHRRAARDAADKAWWRK